MPGIRLYLSGPSSCKPQGRGHAKSGLHMVWRALECEESPIPLTVATATVGSAENITIIQCDVDRLPLRVPP